MLPPIAPFCSPKHILRERMKAERAKAFAARPDAARHAAARFIAGIDPRPDAVIAVYAPIKDELDTGPLVEALRDRGCALALPVIVRRGAPLAFRRFEPGDQLAAGPLGVMQPAPEAAEVAPDTVVTPLLGWSRQGGRLGYGAGYYDRTIRALRQRGQIIVVGYGFGAQETDRLPMGPSDERLDWIVTEREAIRAG